MPRKTKTTASITTLPIGTTTSPPTTVSDTTGTPAPAATGSPALQTTAPPVINLPALRPAFRGAIAASRGAYPSGEQVAAIPGALLVLHGTSFQKTFGSLVPSASHLADDLANAAGWSTLRQALLACLLCVKSEEVFNWSIVRPELEQLDVVFQAVTANNPALLPELAALAKLLDVPKQSAQRGASTRAGKAKANAAHAAAAAAQAPAPTTGAEAAPAVSPSAAVSGGGGATH